MFWGYRKEKLSDGTESVYEVWLSKEIFERNRQRNKKYRSNPMVAERMRKNNLAWRSNPENKERSKKRAQEWRAENLEIIKKKVSEYNSLPKSRELKKIRDKRYRNKPEAKELYKKYRKRKKSESPEFALGLKVRTRIWYALKRKRVTQREKSSELVGCSFLFLKKHLEIQFREGMSWDKPNSFHIDHIRPLASFDLTDPEQRKAACHWSNLQPLYPEENLRKGAKILTT